MLEGSQVAARDRYLLSGPPQVNESGLGPLVFFLPSASPRSQSSLPTRPSPTMIYRVVYDTAVGFAPQSVPSCRDTKVGLTLWVIQL